MVHSLYNHLQIPVPETALVILTNVFQTNQDEFYAVQASEAVFGESSLKAHQDSNTIFQEEAYSLQVIGALLTNPSDGSFKNFKYSPQYKTFISIDNDLVFKPELTGTDDKKIVNVKSMLYLLPQIDLPIPESVKTFFTTLDPHLTTLSWLQDLSEKNREYQLLYTRLAFQRTRYIYQNLLPHDEVPSVATCLQEKVQVDAQLHSDSFCPEILIPEYLVTHFIKKLQVIGETFENNRSVSLQALFEEISPALGKYYRKLKLKFSKAEEALEALWGERSNGVDYSEISSLLNQEEFCSSWVIVELDEKLAPETFFKKYKDKLISESSLDQFIKRHSERKQKNALNLQVALKEVQSLIQEELTSSKSIREIVDFCHSLSKISENKSPQIQEITSLLSNLPHPEMKWLQTLEKYFLRPDENVPEDLTSSSVPALCALMKQRTFLLSESENQYLFDQQGNIKKSSLLTGRSRVTGFPEKNPEFYLKQYPEWPGYEFASILFMRLFGVTHLPYHDLLIINNYPALLTQKAHGKPVHLIWQNPQAFNNLDPVHTTLLIISAILINPEDGKEDNFILSEDGKYLIPIDNDHCFLPSTFLKEGSLWNAFTVNMALQTKTLLFCLDEMKKPIPQEVSQHILSINFDLLLTSWMTELNRLENKLNNLVEQNPQNKFLEQGTVMRIPFYKQFIHNIHWKAHTVQEIIKTGVRLTPFDLFKAVEPFVARCYESSFQQESNLQGRFKAATTSLYKKTSVNGSRVSVLNTRTMMEIINVSKEDLQNDIMFQKMGPVDTLELLNQLKQERNQRVTMKQEILCELDEKKQEKKWISHFGNSPVETGLKTFFANPKEGLVLKGSKLITSSKLTELFAQTPDKGTRIRFLSLPESPSLSDKEMRILTEGCPNIEYLNVSGCVKLKEILTMEGEWPSLARLEAKNCVNLEKVICLSPLKILQIETDQKVEIIVEKPTLDIFTLLKRKAGFEFSFKKRESFQIKSPNFNFSSDDFRKGILDPKEWNEIKDCFRDTKLTIGMSSISSGEDLSIFVININLQDSNVKTEVIERMVRLKLTSLKSVDLSLNEITDNGLGKLAFQNWPLLEALNLHGTKITATGVETIVRRSKWFYLKRLDLSCNEVSCEGLSVLPLAEWPLLEYLNLSNTKLSLKGVETILYRSKWLHLKHLDLSKNEISDEGLSVLTLIEWPLLEYLNLSNTKLSLQSLTINSQSKWRQFQLKYLDISHNHVSNEGLLALTLEEWPLLEELNLKNTQITPQDIEILVKKMKLPSLKKLDISENAILDEGLRTLVSGSWPHLEHLVYYDTQVTLEGNVFLLENFIWPNLSYIEHSLSGSFYDFDENFDEWSPSEIILATAPMYYKTKSGDEPYLRVLVLDLNWLNSKEIYLSIDYDDLDGKIVMLPREKLNQFDTINFSLDLPFTQFIVWPSNLKTLDLSKNSFLDEKKLESFPLEEYPSLECLCLWSTNITAIGIAIIITRLDWLNLKKLDISFNPIGDQGLQILTLVEWQQLESLDLARTGITAHGIEVLVRESTWPHLKKLNLCWNEIKDEGLEILTSAKLQSLEDLNLISTGITAEGIKVLAGKSNWPCLRKLHTYGNQINDEVIEILIFVKWQLLEDLNLVCSTITTQGVSILVRQPYWPYLRKLNLSINPIRDKGLEILALAKWQLLDDLNLACTEITAKGIEVLVRQSNWPSLKKLSLVGNPIHDKGLEFLSSGNWPLLEKLNLQSVGITGRGIESLVKISNWSNLKTLDISENRWASDGGLEALSSGKWPLLECLNLDKTNISVKEIEYLLNKSSWPHLKEICLEDEMRDDDEIDTIQKLISGKWPNLKPLMKNNRNFFLFELMSKAFDDIRLRQAFFENLHETFKK